MHLQADATCINFSFHSHVGDLIDSYTLRR